MSTARLTDDQMARLVDLEDRGWRVADIARELGRIDRTVRNAVQRVREHGWAEAICYEEACARCKKPYIRPRRGSTFRKFCRPCQPLAEQESARRYRQRTRWDPGLTCSECRKRPISAEGESGLCHSCAQRSRRKRILPDAEEHPDAFGQLLLRWKESQGYDFTQAAAALTSSGFRCNARRLKKLCYPGHDRVFVPESTALSLAEALASLKALDWDLGRWQSELLAVRPARNRYGDRWRKEYVAKLETDDPFIQALKVRILRAELTQRDMAELTDLNQTQVPKWLEGKRPALSHLQNAAWLLVDRDTDTVKIEKAMAWICKETRKRTPSRVGLLILRKISDQPTSMRHLAMQLGSKNGTNRGLSRLLWKGIAAPAFVERLVAALPMSKAEEEELKRRMRSRWAFDAHADKGTGAAADKRTEEAHKRYEEHWKLLEEEGEASVSKMVDRFGHKRGSVRAWRRVVDDLEQLGAGGDPPERRG